MSEDEKLQQLRRDYACALAVTIGDHLGWPREQLQALKSLVETGTLPPVSASEIANQVVSIAWQIALQYPDVDALEFLNRIQDSIPVDIFKAAQDAANLIQPVARS